MESQEKKENRGGARPGAGRKSKGREAKMDIIAISCSPVEKEKIRQLAKDAGKTTSRFLIELALEENK